MNRPEEREQRALIQWADVQPMPAPHRAGDVDKIGDALLHVPNGGGRSKAEAGVFKALGVRAGVPDLLLTVPANGCAGLWMELKAPGSGRLNEAQHRWIARLRGLGYSAAVCQGWHAAAGEIVAYLGEGDEQVTGTTAHIVESRT